MPTDRRQTPPRSSDPTVALVAIGIGRVRRGYERYFSDLYEVLRPRLDVTLYVGALQEEDAGHNGRRLPGSLTLPNRLARLVPLRRVAGGSEYRGYERECLAYALALIPKLRRGDHDIVHVIDHPLAKALGRARRLVPMRSTVVYSNACAAPARFYPPADHVQHIAGPLYDQAIADGYPASKLSLAPCGVHTSRFRAPFTKQGLRERHGVDRNTTVLLAISALKRPHKRVDHLIEEVARLGREDVLLWIDGSPEDPSLVDLARDRLGRRCRITHVPSEQVPELLGLADVFVHAALEEAFGLAIVEAMSAGLPVLVHDSPHFRWLAGEHGRFVDMSESGALAAALRDAASAYASVTDELASEARRRFDWDVVVDTYLDMYRRLASAPAEASA